MRTKFLVLLVASIALVVAGVVLHSMDHPKVITFMVSMLPSETNNVQVFVYGPKPEIVLPPPLYAQLWFVPLTAGLAMLAFLGVKRFKV